MVQAGKKNSSLKPSRMVNTCILIASRVRNISLRSVMKHSLSDIPHALFNDDGTMTKTDKSKLAAALKFPGSMIECDLGAETTIIDAMALLHQQVLFLKHLKNLQKGS